MPQISEFPQVRSSRTEAHRLKIAPRFIRRSVVCISFKAFFLFGLVGHWPIHPRSNHCKVRNNFGFPAVVGHPQTGAPNACGGSFPKICKRVPGHGPQRENMRVWNGLAQRWLRCAKLIEQLEADLRSSELKRRQKHLKIVAH